MDGNGRTATYQACPQVGRWIPKACFTLRFQKIHGQECVLTCSSYVGIFLQFEGDASSWIYGGGTGLDGVDADDGCVILSGVIAVLEETTVIGDGGAIEESDMSCEVVGRIPSGPVLADFDKVGAGRDIEGSTWPFCLGSMTCFDEKDA